VASENESAGKSWAGVSGAPAAIASTAILVRFGTGLDPWWPLMWFAAAAGADLCVTGFVVERGEHGNDEG
jgi:hypothetical protein